MIYVDILTGKYLSSIWVAILAPIQWSVRLSSSGGGDEVKGVDEDQCYFSQLRVCPY